VKTFPGPHPLKPKTTLWTALSLVALGNCLLWWQYCEPSVYWSALSAIGQIAAIPALLFAAYSFKKGAKMQHYEQIDGMYADLLKVSLEVECLSRPELCTDRTKRHQYDTYAYMLWNFIETIFDRCDDDEDLIETWSPVMDYEAHRHRAWLAHPRNRLRFKRAFLEYLHGRYGIGSFAWRRATLSDLSQISALQQSFFGPDAIPAGQYVDWFRQSPTGFFVIESLGPERKFLGHVTLLAIQDGVFQRYLSGAIKESAITADQLIKSGAAASRHLYLESIIIPEREDRRKLRPYLWETIGLMIESLNVGPVEKVYAMAATDDGKRFLQAARFARITPPSGGPRVDQHEMYGADYADLIRLMQPGTNEPSTMTG